MKLLTSFYSSSPSSSSTFSFDPFFSTSKTASAGCFTTIFHRIKEFHSKSISSEKVQNLKTNTTISSSPCIVARLMGLNSMAENEIVMEESMNSANSVKSSSLFNEVPPSFHLLENENFLVFSFESRSKSEKFKSKERRKEKGCVELKKNKREKLNDEKGKLGKRVSDMCSINVENDGEFEVENVLFKVGNNGEKVKKRKKGKTCLEKKVESECGSEDSSPVSVFDFERDVNGTEEDLCGIGMSWRRKLSPVLENEQLFIIHSDSNLMNEEKNVKEIENKNNMHEGSKKKERQNKECVDIWGKICRLVEDELVGSNQLSEVKRQKSDFESISADFESEILDHLLDELIDQFVTCCL